MKLVIANWKMNPQSSAAALKLLKIQDSPNTIILPPFIYLPLAGKILKKSMFGAQDVFWFDQGAYTGEISPIQLKNMGVKYVLVGHSERRNIIGEDDVLINKKIKAALQHNLNIILCIGENIKIRKKGIQSTINFLHYQLKKDLDGINKKFFNKLFIAYEPLWAIGTGYNDDPVQSNQIAKFIKSQFKFNINVIYGGSVNSKNIVGFLSQSFINGVLVGGASLISKEISFIIKAAKKYE
ncbi:MAG: triose-phosphate isomerase [Minisyncoccia bacterium]